MIPDYVYCLPHQHTGNEQKRPAIYKQAFENLNKNVVSTRKQIRTATPLPAPPPQDGASTNFATRV